MLCLIPKDKTVPALRDASAAVAFRPAFLHRLLAAPDLVFCSNAAAAPATPGAYVLAVAIDAALAVRIAGRGAGTLAAGVYLYCGSANGPGGLRARVGRHMKRRKTVRWHVDQLTTRGKVLGAWVAPGGNECELVGRLSHLEAPIAGFGSSDCTHCRSHLLVARYGIVSSRRPGRHSLAVNLCPA